MAKKQKSLSTKTDKKNFFDPEKYAYFTPISFLIIFIGLVILFSEFIFSNQMLSGSDTIQAGIFFRQLLVDSVLQHGSIPQWNPYIFGGMPYVDAFHGDIFYPLSFFKFFGTLYRSMGYILFFHIFLAGLTMYFCARQFKLSKIAGLLSAICYMFAAYLISLVAPGHDGKIFVTALFPLTILFLDRGFEATEFKKAFIDFSVLGLVIGLIILSPHVQMMYFSLWAVSFYSAFRLIAAYVKDKSVPGFLRPAVLTTYAVVVGILLSAIQFYPGYIYTNEYSPRTDSKSGWDWATSWSLHEEEAMSMLIPEFSGTLSSNPDYSQKTYYWGKNAFKDNSETVGIVGIFMALLALFFIRKKEAYFFGGLAFFAFIYALGATTPVFKIFFHLIPKVKSLRAPSMIMFLFSFSIALLAGMGLQKVMDTSRSFKDTILKRYNILLIAVPGFFLLLAILFSFNGKGMLDLWASLFYSEASRTMVQQNFSKLDVAYLNLGGIQSGAWISFLCTAVTSVILWLYQTKKAGMMILCLILFIPLVNGVRFNKRFIATVDQTKIWAENPVTQFFKKTGGQYRVMNFVGNMIKEDFLPHFGVEVVVGYHGNQLKWYDNFLGGPNKKNQANPNFLNLSGAKYLLLPGNQGFPPDYFGEKPLTQAANLGQLQIVKNDNALERVFLKDKFEVIPDNLEIFDKIINGTGQYKQSVYLEKNPELVYNSDSANTDSASIIAYQPEEIRINCSISQNKLLVLTDNYYDGWKVFVDGQQQEILRAYGTFRAVEIPQGTKEVIFKYDSQRYRTGKLVTIITGFFLFSVFGFYFGAGYLRRKKEVEA